ncbi:MAG: CrcB family protein [Bryobacteraceae bacterium]|nr:CrcB family protein [Bryobacteraceae bacterium]
MLVALGGATGSVARYLAAVWFGAGPLTTFVVNVTGSFLIGLLVALTPASDIRVRLLLATGVLGGYTTFSAWQMEALTARDWPVTAAILFGSLAAGFIAVAAGYWLGTRIVTPS